mgnify:FL=1
MENLNYFKNAGNQGYILLPRRLLLNALFLQSPERQYYRLYIYLLLKATYGEGRTDGESLKRGELYFSYRTLCEQFSVCRATLSKMLNEMEECELIEIYRGKTNRQSSKIKMLYYEQMCDFATIFEEPSGKSDYEFEVFWDIYHNRSGLEPIDKELAHHYWKRLSSEERTLALVNVDVYFSDIPRSRWRTAVEYLGYKNFLGN